MVVEKVIIVSVHVLQFLQFFQFMSDRLRQVMQVTSGYVSLCQRDGTWSSTITFVLVLSTTTTSFIASYKAYTEIESTLLCKKIY